MPWTRQGGHLGKPKKPLSEIVSELLASKKNANRRPLYVNTLRICLTKFAQNFKEIDQITIQEVETWLSRYGSASSRQTWLNRISTLFSYAVRKGYARENICNRIDRVRVDRKTPMVLTVEQSRTLLSHCPESCKPYLILGMFAGVRPEEIMRLDWAAVSLETSTVCVEGKTRIRRIVPLEPIAVKLLEPLAKSSGRVAPSHSTVRRWKQIHRSLIGGKWEADVLRHTAASYLLAKYGDAGKVSMMLGNSSRILLTHYHEPVTKTEMERFWKL